MSYAHIAALYVRAHCKQTFKNPDNMESHVCSGSFIDVFDHKGYGTHKYIPADKLSADLDMESGSGVYGFFQMSDDSYLLLTCPGRVAYWSGKSEDKAQWPQDRADLIG